MSQIVFDRNIAERLEAAYAARDILRRRELVYAALEPRPGQRILDVGCGPGFYVSELLEQVGPEGFVTGIDVSADMLALARERCARYSNVSLQVGEATAIPAESGSFDGALSVQVLEYVANVDVALAEVYRCLGPGGRVVIWDIDWTTVSWHSADPERMERVLRAWDAHLADPALPRTLGRRFRAAGFENVEAVGHAFTGTDLSADGYIGAIFPLLEEYLLGSGLLRAGEVEAWATEQRELSTRGDLFFSCIQFCVAATRSS